MKNTTAREPKWAIFGPDWWHHNGTKIKISVVDDYFILLASDSAKIEIGIIVDEGHLWEVKWEVVHGLNSKTGGETAMTKEMLSSAFGLSDPPNILGDWLVEKYGAESAEQGNFIRWQKWLNIPSPGTGHHGDPNISIYISDEIRDAVKKLLEKR